MGSRRRNRGEANAGYAQLRSAKLREISAPPQAYACEVSLPLVKMAHVAPIV